jgi:serine/threonine protein kinase
MTQTVSSSQPSRLGSYQILEKIGNGGMATVYKASSPARPRPVAIKVLTPQAASNPLLVERFKQEYRALCQLDHAHLVRGLDFGLDGATPFLVMELVEGEDLAARIDRGGKLPEEEAVSLLIQVARAVQLAHDHQIIHRDIKPSNILITPGGAAKLTDLGLVKDYQSTLDLTRPLMGLGTPNYMAPEQFGDARNATVRCDIYSLGASLYSAVTGELPFCARSPLYILKKKLKNDLAPPQRLTPGLSQRVADAICRALRADPNERPASCREFIDSLLPPLPPRCAGTSEIRSPKSQTVRTVSDCGFRASGFPRSGVEARAKIRFCSQAETSCWPVVEKQKANWTARVENISASGVCLRLKRRFEPGTLLAIELRRKNRSATTFVLVRVLWVKQESAKTWALGGAFERGLLDWEVEDWL